MTTLSIEIIEFSGNNRTPLRQYLYGLTVGAYFTPQYGQWREHDETWHFDRIRSLTQCETELVIGCANIALHYIDTDEDRKNEFHIQYISENIDHYLEFWGKKDTDMELRMQTYLQTFGYALPIS